MLRISMFPVTLFVFGFFFCIVLFYLKNTSFLLIPLSPKIMYAFEDVTPFQVANIEGRVGVVNGLNPDNWYKDGDCTCYLLDKR